MLHLTHKKAQPHQFSEILQLLKIAAQELKSKGIDQWSYWLNPPEERLEWAKNGFDNEEFYFIYHHKEIIGMYRLCTEDLLYWGKQEEPAFYIHSLVVHPDYKGKQIGSMTLKTIEQIAVKEQISILRLDCNAANLALCNYYKKQGFKFVGKKQMTHSINNLYEKNLSSL